MRTGAKRLRSTARSIGQQLINSRASSDRDIETAFARLPQRGVGALLVGTGASLSTIATCLVALAAAPCAAASYSLRESFDAVGLMTYAPSFSDALRQVGASYRRSLNG